MRNFAMLFVAAAMTVGTFGLTGCEKEETMTPPADTGTGTMDSATDTMEADPATTEPAPTTAPATPAP